MTHLYDIFQISQFNKYIDSFYKTVKPEPDTMRAEEFVAEADEPLFIGGHRVPRSHPMYDVLMRKAAELKAQEEPAADEPRKKPRVSVRAASREVPDEHVAEPASEPEKKKDWSLGGVDAMHQAAHRQKKDRYWPHR
jgi:hypothetical protein